VGSFSNSIIAEKPENIRVGVYGGVDLKFGFCEKSKNIRVGVNGGVVLKFGFCEKLKNIRVGVYGGVVLKRTNFGISHWLFFNLYL